jgi:hypothetical protein
LTAKLADINVAACDAPAVSVDKLLTYLSFRRWFDRASGSNPTKPGTRKDPRMISNQKWMLHGALSLAVVLSAAEVRAQKLETPGAPAAEAAPTTSPSGPTGFGDTGQFVLSAENLFGFTYDHPSTGTSRTTYGLLASPFGVTATPYEWPRFAFDYFLTKSISGGAGLGFARSTSGSDAIYAFQAAPRLGYGMMVGPWLAVWPKVGVTYVNSTGQSYLGLTIDIAAAIMVAPHLAITLAPEGNIGLSGTRDGAAHKLTTVGLQFGLAIPF